MWLRDKKLLLFYSAVGSLTFSTLQHFTVQKVAQIPSTKDKCQESAI